MGVQVPAEDPLELELEVVVSHQMWVLGAELWGLLQEQSAFVSVYLYQ